LNWGEEYDEREKKKEERQIERDLRKSRGLKGIDERGRETNRIKINENK